MPFEPRTVQPIASRYRDYTVPYPTIIIIIIIIIIIKPGRIGQFTRK